MSRAARKTPPLILHGGFRAANGAEAMSWYVRSLGDHDTHRGVLNPAAGTVTAACGVTFTPRLLPLALPGAGDPPDPDQICPDCHRVKATK